MAFLLALSVCARHPECPLPAGPVLSRCSRRRHPKRFCRAPRSDDIRSCAPCVANSRIVAWPQRLTRSRAHPGTAAGLRSLRLNRRTGNGRVRAEHAAIPGLGAKRRSATGTVIEQQTMIGRHQLCRPRSAMRTGNGRFHALGRGRHAQMLSDGEFGGTPSVCTRRGLDGMRH